MTAGRATALVIGHTVVDHRFWVDTFPPRRGRTAVERYRLDLGGPAAVASIAITSLGGRARLVSRVGRDDAGEQAAAMLERAGIDTSLMQEQDSATTAVSAVIVAPDGKRYILPFPGNLKSTAPEIQPESLDGIDVVLTDSRWPRHALAYAEAARRQQIPVIVDLDVDEDDMWSVARTATHVVCDEDLAEAMGGTDTLLRRIHDLGTWGAVTLGARGVATRSGLVRAFPVEVTDSTGAGDVFHGAFALRIAEGSTPDSALEFAAAAGAEKCRLGRVPSRTEVSRRLLQRRN